MNYGIIDDKSKYIEGYNYSLTNSQSSKLAIIIRNLLIYVSSNSKIDDDYKTLSNLGYRLLGGDYSTVRIIDANYERLLSAKKKNIELIKLYERILSLVTKNKLDSIPIASINVRNGNFDKVINENDVDKDLEEIPVIKKPVLVVSHPKKLDKSLKLELKPGI